MSDLLALALSIQNELRRANAIHWLVPYLSESLVSRAMKAARSMQNMFARADMFHHQLLPQLKVMETDVAIWQEVLHGLSYRDRTSFLDDIPKLAPAIISLSGGDIKALQRVIDTL